MVYLGPSKGCISCRQRRKKCDETRPSCTRCIRAHRTCGGYEASRAADFRSFTTQGVEMQEPVKSIARKCTLPVRQPAPGSDTLPVDSLPTEVTLAQSNELALKAFIYDWCITSGNANLSRNYLVNLEQLTRHLGPKSDLARACIAVSCSSHGKTKRRPQLVDRAEGIYHELLGSMAKALQNAGAVDSRESRYIAMLLGLYQIAIPGQKPYSIYDAHSKGLAAIMGIEHSPRGLIKPFAIRNGKSNMHPGIFSTRALTDGGTSLGDLLLRLDTLWTKFETALEMTDMLKLRNDAVALERDYYYWQTTRSADLQPTKAGEIKSNTKSQTPSPGCWPGKVDTYFDLYVAGVWNVFRTSWLLLNFVLLEIFKAVGPDGNETTRIHTVNGLVGDMAASIPYHLTDNLQMFLAEVDMSGEITDRGKSLGGLLLLHPLYIASNLSFLEDNVREYMRACLKWIGSHMGFGQATLLAENSNVHRDYLASGWMIIWSGFLV